MSEKAKMSGDGDAGSLRAHTAQGSHIQRSRNRTIYTAGRPPWYNEAGEQRNAFIIGITGGSASGKTTVARKIIEDLDIPWVCLLSMDSFYKVLNKEQLELAHHNKFDFDHPDAFDTDLIVETLKKLKQGKQVEVPIYDFTTHSRRPETITMYGANVIIFEGILAFTSSKIRDVMDVKIFVDEDADVRLARRLRRDIRERGRDLQGALLQYMRFVKPSFDQHIYPTMQYADLVVPRGTNNHVAMELIINHVQSQLRARGFHIRRSLLSIPSDTPMPNSLHVLKQTSQVRAMHTILRNRETKRDDFVFYSDRLMRNLIEFALSLLPYDDVEVKMPGRGGQYQGCKLVTPLCGVSIVRAGLTMEAALRHVLSDIPVGKILIQTNEVTNEPELHYCMLPKDISKQRILLMDATVASGAAALMAIRVLIDHDVPQENIFFVTVLAATMGIHSIAYAFPRVRIIASAVDANVNEQYHILPGIGNYGDRYFGTEP
eukprot:m.177439 g.177439  ORF g.177439 m.177439 type:complete len:489 (-) comp17382_c0_seq2:1674-3140(-)